MYVYIKKVFITNVKIGDVYTFDPYTYMLIQRNIFLTRLRERLCNIINYNLYDVTNSLPDTRR